MLTTQNFKFSFDLNILKNDAILEYTLLIYLYLIGQSNRTKTWHFKQSREKKLKAFTKIYKMDFLNYFTKWSAL